MTTRFAKAYAIINKSTNRCGQIINTNTVGWKIDNETHFSVEISPEYSKEYLDKYYYDGVWHERIYTDLDENGRPTPNSTYTDVPWSPSNS